MNSYYKYKKVCDIKKVEKKVSSIFKYSQYNDNVVTTTLCEYGSNGYESDLFVFETS